MSSGSLHSINLLVRNLRNGARTFRLSLLWTPDIFVGTLSSRRHEDLPSRGNDSQVLPQTVTTLGVVFCYMKKSRAEEVGTGRSYAESDASCGMTELIPRTETESPHACERTML